MRGTRDEWLWEKETKSGRELVGNDKDGVVDIGNCGVKSITDSWGPGLMGPLGDTGPTSLYTPLWQD